MDFERLVGRHKDAVYRQLYRLCGNHEDAEDVLVDSLLAAHRSLRDLQHEEAFRSWLYRISSRACTRLKKKERLLSVINLDSIAEPFDKSPAAEDRLLDADVKTCLLHAYQELPTAYQDVYRLRDVEALSGEETAERLGITVRAMKSRLHRARKLLREKCDAAFAASQ